MQNSDSWGVNCVLCTNLCNSPNAIFLKDEKPSWGISHDCGLIGCWVVVLPGLLPWQHERGNRKCNFAVFFLFFSVLSCWESIRSEPHKSNVNLTLLPMHMRQVRMAPFVINHSVPIALLIGNKCPLIGSSYSPMDHGLKLSLLVFLGKYATQFRNWQNCVFG